MHELLADWCEILNRLLRDVANTQATAQARDTALRHAHRHSCQAPICFRMSGTTVSHLAETLDCAIRASCARSDRTTWVLALDVAYTKFVLYLIRDVDRWSSSGLEEQMA